MADQTHETDRPDPPPVAMRPVAAQAIHLFLPVLALVMVLLAVFTGLAGAGMIAGWVAVAATLAGGVALAVGFRIVLHRAVQQPIAALEARVRQAGADADDPIVWPRDDAVGRIVDALNIIRRQRAEARRMRTLLIDAGIQMSAERHLDRLFETILQAARSIYNADGGTLYIVDDEADALKFAVILNSSLGLHSGGSSGQEIPFPPLPLHDAEGAPNHRNIATHAALTGRIVNIPDAYASDLYDFTGPRRFDEAHAYRSTSFLAVPLRNRLGQLVGVLQLINATDPGTGTVVPFGADKESFVEALAVQAGVSLENSLLLQAQRRLLDSFIELIAAAIDSKSPYTGGHCARVPELTKMIAQAACEADDGPLKDFALTDDEWYELHIAGWLHDCGKVTSPEYVVDKATKLETIYNRIHEIRTRFEMLWRDADLAYWQGIAAAGGGEAAAGAEVVARLATDRETTQAALRDEFAFIATCNIGGEFMADEKIKRLKEIGARTWIRHFDDRLGLSPDEERRLEAHPPADLPATELLLADKDEHVVPWPAGRKPLEEDDFGMKMEVPDNSFNLGEIYNLSIRRGTLTAEERYKINDHIVQTIIMLESLPFPKSLRRVPEYAGGHHEKMDGTGYPRRLTAEQMSLPARMMAIADVFEALTASDRPYKKAKTLSESIRILSFMRNDGHIDPDLFDLFLRAGVYRRYADEFLDPSQIDDVDIGQYLGRSPVARA